MTTGKNNRISEDDGSFHNKPSSPNSSSRSTPSSKTSKPLSKQKYGKYQSIALRISAEWLPHINRVIHSLCKDESILSKFGSPSCVYAHLKLFCASDKTNNNEQILMVNRRTKLHVYAPKAKNCWFLLVRGNEPDDLIACDRSKTEENDFKTGDYIKHCTNSDCKIGVVFHLQNDLYIHILSELNLKGVIENKTKLKDNQNLTNVADYKPNEKLNEELNIEELYSPLSYCDEETIKEITKEDIIENQLDTHLQFLIDHYWKGRQTTAIPSLSFFKSKIKSLTETMIEESEEAERQSGYITEDQDD